MKKILLNSKRGLMTLVVCLLAMSVHAANKTWDGGGANDNWNNADNWNGNTLPAVGDDIFIPSGYAVIVTASTSCRSLTFTMVTGSTTGGTLTLNPGITLTVTGTGVGAGIITKNNETQTSSITNLAGTGTINCAGFVVGGTTTSLNGDHTITINSNVGSLAISGNLNLNGEDDVNDEQSTVFNLASGSMTVSGTVSTDEEGGSVVTFNVTGGTLNLPGATPFTDAVGALTFTPSGGTVNYSGGVAQTVKAATYNSITFSGGGAKTLGGAIIVNGAGTFTNGIVNNGGFSFTFTGAATASGASNSSFVNGQVTKSGNAGFTFPVGKTGAGYHAIEIGAVTPTAATTFTAEYIRSSASALAGVNPPLNRVSNCEYWTLDRAVGAPALNPTVRLYWTPSSGCAPGDYITGEPNFVGLEIARLSGVPGPANKWSQEPATRTAGSTNSTGSITTDAVVTTWTATTRFTFGSTTSESPLPVKLGGIQAYEKHAGIQIDWTVYSEENLSRYQVERSADGRTFDMIGTVASRNVQSESRYGFFDANPLAGVSYYRLKSVDFDSKSAYSSIVRVNLDKSIKDITLYPNPVRAGVVAIQAADLSRGNYEIRIFNGGGQQVYSQKFTHNGGMISHTIQLPASVKPGVYSMSVDNDGWKVMNKVFIVQ